MNGDEALVGMTVRYPRTGTSGKILAIDEIDGDLYAELDSTHLRYRLDQLVGLKQAESTVRNETDEAGVAVYLEQEKEFAERLKEAWVTTDQSCEGGG